MKKYRKSVFLFRRDLRLTDNTGLIEASKSSIQTIPCFILDSVLLKKSNPKRSKFRFQFLQDCLTDLEEQLQSKGSHLHMFSGNPEIVVEELIKFLRVDAVFANADYTPFSKKRDEKIRKVCIKHKVDFSVSNDLLLHNVNEIKTLKGHPYKVFTQFFSKAKELPVRGPQVYQFSNLSNQKIKSEISINKLGKVF